MAFHATAYSVVYLAGVFVAASAGYVAWQRRTAPGGVSLLLVILAAGWWCLCDALESAAVGIPTHVVWAQAAFLGNMTVGVLTLLFAIEYTGRRRLPDWGVGVLFVVPAIGVAAAATNGLHHLIWTGFSIVPGTMNLVLYSHGWLAWVVTLYSLAVALVAGIVLVEFALRARTLYRLQSIAILVAVVIPWIAEIIYVSNVRFLPGIDPSVTLAVSGALLSIGLVRFRLLDLVPVAREKLIEHMEDGLLVLDAGRRVIDSNPAAGRIVGSAHEGWVGADVRTVFAAWPEMAACLAGETCGDGETTLVSPAGRSISVTVVRLEDSRGELGGSLVTMRDATGQAETEAALQAMNADLHKRVAQVEELQEELREQALRDPLTGLFNRRYMTVTLEREIGRAAREAYPVSIVMIDVDHFKRINDEHGHAAGDQALRFLGALLRAGLRTGDIACRFGGDEFLMVLPNTTTEIARVRAEEWRTAVRDSSVFWAEWGEMTTLSLGVASFPEHGASAAEIMTAVDAALYEAKSAGRDRTVVVSGGPGPAEAAETSMR